jgi:hypothetical protein
MGWKMELKVERSGQLFVCRRRRSINEPVPLAVFLHFLALSGRHSTAQPEHSAQQALTQSMITMTGSKSTVLLV